MTYRVLPYRCDILRVSLQQPDCFPSTGSRSGQAPPPEWLATATEVGLVSAQHPDTTAESPLFARPLTLSGHDLWRQK